MDTYEHIYRQSWKADEPHKRFIREIVTNFAANGNLRLGLASVANQPAAAQIWFCHGGTASIFKLAYDPKFTDLSVGSLLTAHLMERSLDVDKVGVVDYLCGDDDYKRDWMTHRRQRIGLRATRAASVAGIVCMAARPARRLRAWIRRQKND
jgi:CelD/BcsL family acetyltransferase involved in cellulose biosynthesis